MFSNNLRAMLFSFKLFIFSLRTKDVRFIPLRRIKCALFKDRFSEPVNLFVKYITCSKSPVSFISRCKGLCFYLNYIKSSSTSEILWLKAKILREICMRKIVVSFYSYADYLKESGNIEALKSLNDNKHQLPFNLKDTIPNE